MSLSTLLQRVMLVGSLLNKIKLLAAVFLGIMSLNAQAAYILYTGTAYYGWTDQLGLLSPSLSSGPSDPVSLEIDFTPTSISSGYYFFDTGIMHLRVGGSSFDTTFSSFNSAFPSINGGYFDSLGLCCSGLPAFSLSLNNNYYYGGHRLGIGIFGGNLNYSERYIDGNGNTYDTNISAHDGSYVFDPVAASSLSAVPEPETYAMLLAGLGLLGFIARRRKQAA